MATMQTTHKKITRIRNSKRSIHINQSLLLFDKTSNTIYKGKVSEITPSSTKDRFVLTIAYWNKSNQLQSKTIHPSSTDFILNKEVNPNIFYSECLVFTAGVNVEYFNEQEENWKIGIIDNVCVSDNIGMITYENDRQVSLTDIHQPKEIREVYPAIVSVGCVENDMPHRSYCSCGKELIPLKKLPNFISWEVINTCYCSICHIDLRDNTDQTIFVCHHANTSSTNYFCNYILCNGCSLFFNKPNYNLLGNLNEVSIWTIVQIATCGERKINISNLEYFSLINKNWNNALNPNKTFVNNIFKQSCLIDFPNLKLYINNMNIKRWDKYYKYKIKIVQKYRKKPNNKESDGDFVVLHDNPSQRIRAHSYSRSDYFAESSNQDFKTYGLIENCQHDIEDINKYYQPPNMKNDNIFTDEIKSNDLPNGFEWKFKCPITFDKLTPTKDPTVFHCDQCKKNVFRVTTTQDLEKKVKENKCITYTVLRGFKRNRIRMTGMPFYNKGDRYDCFVDVSSLSPITVIISERFSVTFDSNGLIKNSIISGDLNVEVNDPGFIQCIIETDVMPTTQFHFGKTKWNLNPKMVSKSWERGILCLNEQGKYQNRSWGRRYRGYEPIRFRIGYNYIPKEYVLMWRVNVPSELKIPFSCSVWTKMENGKLIVSAAYTHSKPLKNVTVAFRVVKRCIFWPKAEILQCDIGKTHWSGSQKANTLQWSLNDLKVADTNLNLNLIGGFIRELNIGFCEQIKDLILYVYNTINLKQLEFAVEGVENIIVEKLFPMEIRYEMEDSFCPINVKKITQVDGREIHGWSIKNKFLVNQDKMYNEYIL
eukprot:183171_1